MTMPYHKEIFWYNPYPWGKEKYKNRIIRAINLDSYPRWVRQHFVHDRVIDRPTPFYIVIELTKEESLQKEPLIIEEIHEKLERIYSAYQVKNRITESLCLAS